MSSKVTISIDFGQDKTLWTQAKETQLYDKDGRKMEFESMIDALNFLSKNGYEFVNAYAVTMGNQNVYHYVLKKKDIN